MQLIFPVTRERRKSRNKQLCNAELLLNTSNSIKVPATKPHLDRHADEVLIDFH